MRNRLLQVLLIASMMWLSWLIMTLAHEGGHVIGARWTGGQVQQVVWHPTVMSRTAVSPNPQPLIEVWAGPLVGVAVPLISASLASLLRLRLAYLAWFVAGFCLIANGAYVGIGAIHPIGDADELITHGTPRWLMALFGAATVIPGLWIWDRVSPRFGFGKSPRPIVASQAYASVLVALLLTAVGFVFGNRGGGR